MLSPLTLAYQHHYFTRCRIGFHVAVGFGYFGEGKGAVEQGRLPARGYLADKPRERGIKQVSGLAGVHR